MMQAEAEKMEGEAAESDRLRQQEGAAMEALHKAHAEHNDRAAAEAEQKLADTLEAERTLHAQDKSEAHTVLTREHDAKLDELTAEIESRAGQSGALKVEVPSIAKEIAEKIWSKFVRTGHFITTMSNYD